MPCVLPVWNGSKIFSRSASGTPGPQSATSIASALPTTPTVTVTGGPAAIALSTRFDDDLAHARRVERTTSRGRGRRRS